jgi:CheY-like chemotaxis protein
VSDFVSFTQNVHDAFGHLYDRVYLQDHPLSRQLFGDGPFAAERLHRALIDSLEWLRPLGGENPKHAEWRRYRHLQLRYVEGAAPEHIARELLVSARQARRDHAEALDELSRLLWERFIKTPAVPPATRPVSLNAPDNLEAELSKMLASTEATPTRIDEVLRSAVETARQLAEENRVVVDVALDPDLPAVGVSRPVSRQLVLNVLADAIVRHPSSTLEIRARVLHSNERHPDGTAGAVDIVFRIVAPDTTSPGLISAAVMELIQRMARGQNVTIHFTPAHSPGDSSRTITIRLPASGGRTLLLVDDNPDVALLFRRFLADTSVRLVQARSAERALRLVRETRPDLVVLDVLLPTTDGWEFLQALRADPATARIPVIVCSVVPDHALARSLGVTDFLPKPVTRGALLATLAQLSGDPADVVDRALPGASG